MRRKRWVHSVSQQTFHLPEAASVETSTDCLALWSKGLRRLLHNAAVTGLHNGLCTLYMNLINALCRRASSWIFVEELGFRRDTNGNITIPFNFMRNFFFCQNSDPGVFETPRTAEHLLLAYIVLAMLFFSLVNV